MRGDWRCTVFSCGCGASVMIEAHRKVVLTDVHYRGRAQDETDAQALDFAPEIRGACADHHLDVFVSTHPDKDHVLGFGDLFHCGPPDKWDSDPDEDEPKIVVDEIWCSSYGANPHYVTEQSKPLTDEIRRRKKLQSTPEGRRAGNRLQIMDTGSHSSGSLIDGFDWRLLAPTPSEAGVPQTDEGSPPASSNSTSLVIQWTIKRNWGDNHILLCGDTSVEVLERLEQQVHRKSPEWLAWHVLLVPHHCSRRSIGRVYNGGCVDEEFEESEAALTALGEQRGDGFVAASSRRVVRGGATPPSWHAKQRYLRILARGGTVDDKAKERFRCTGGNAQADKPAHVVFNLTAGGPTLAATAAPAKVGLGGGASVGGGGS